MHMHLLHMCVGRTSTRGLIAVIALGAALVALGTWVVIDQTRSSSAQGLASADVAAMLKDRHTALNRGDAHAIARFYAPNAVLEERDVTPAIVTRGREDIGQHIAALSQLGLRLESASPVIKLGDTVAEATNVPGSSMAFILVYKLDANGKIANQWVLPAS